MTSVGIMASAVSLPSAVDVLFEPFNNFTFAPWTLAGGTPTIVAARTGNGASFAGNPASLFARYTIPSGNESATLTVGVAHRINNATGTRSILRLESDSAATSHIYVQVLTNGTVEIRVAGSGGALLASTAPGVLAINTYNYIELQAVLDDTAGSVTLRVNGTQVAAASGIDTKNAGTKTGFDTLCLLGPAGGITSIFDDLYLTMGPGAAFKGSITIP